MKDGHLYLSFFIELFKVLVNLSYIFLSFQKSTISTHSFFYLFLSFSINFNPFLPFSQSTSRSTFFNLCVPDQLYPFYILSNLFLSLRKSTTAPIYFYLHFSINFYHFFINLNHFQSLSQSTNGTIF